MQSGSAKRPKVFIASSTKNLLAAYTIQTQLKKLVEFADFHVWDQVLPGTGRTILENLIGITERYDWAIFMFAPDDVLHSGGKTVEVVRDNVLLEYGLFMGRRGRERALIVLPKGLHLPVDLGGLLTFPYDRDEPNLESALTPPALQIQRTLKANLDHHPCSYLSEYVRRKEPSLLVPDLEIDVTYDRGYQILLDMFENASVEEFRAFDLAFDRWKELLRDDAVQIQNTSRDIFEFTRLMLEQDRCRRFRRILVLNADQLKGQVPLLRHIEQHEAAWRKEYPRATVETRIFRYPGRQHPDARRVAELNDFALFQGEAGQLAIIEALEQPTDSKRSRLKVVTRAERTTSLERGFDDFWNRSFPIRHVIDRLLAPGEGPSEPTPVPQALRQFLLEANTGATTAVAVEAAYVDLRTPEDEDRFVHLNEALHLAQAIQTTCPALASSIFLDAFINNYTSCRVDRGDARRELSDGHTDACQTLIVEELLPRISRSYALDPENFRHFEMRAHSNDVRDVIREALHSGKREIEERDEGEATLDIYAVTRRSRILLGSRRAESWDVVPRCTALMAQHYYDLYRFVLEKKPELKELWIFDFNRYIETAAVKMGAEASLVLHPWPQDFRLRIVNCSYAPDGQSGYVELTKWPD